MPPHIAKKVLIIFKRLWYTYPKEKFGYRSYYTVIKNLILKMSKSEEIAKEFVDEYPMLLYAAKISLKDKKLLNERKYCLEWFKQNRQYTLVQDTFKYIGIKSLEEKGEEENVLPIIAPLTKKQKQYVDILVKCINEIFRGFFEEKFPECMCIKNLKASVSGYASLISKKAKTKNVWGYVHRYSIQKICIKEKHFKKNSFAQALTVMIHELCHNFGGDKSESFSYALTEALSIVINNQFIIEKYKKYWENI